MLSLAGEGSYGQVTKGTHKDTGAVRAIKAINRHKISDPARFQVEAGKGHESGCEAFLDRKFVELLRFSGRFYFS